MFPVLTMKEKSPHNCFPGSITESERKLSVCVGSDLWRVCLQVGEEDLSLAKWLEAYNFYY